MKKGIINIMIAVAVLTLGSCASNGDIDDLQDQLDQTQDQLADLDGKLAELQQAQQEDLLAAIAALQSQITDLAAENSDHSSEYDALLVSLTTLEDEIAAGEKVFYGNVLTDADYAEVVSMEATVITGDVVVKSNDNSTALSTVKMVGGDLMIKGGSAIALSSIESVGGELVVTGVSTEPASVTLSMLKTVGKGLTIENNDELDSFDAPVLVLINGDLEVSTNEWVASITMASLDLVDGDIDMDNYVERNYGPGDLGSINLSETDVTGDVSLQYLGMGSQAALGMLQGDLFVSYTNLSSLSLTNTTFYGNMNIENNSSISAIVFDNLTTVNGNIRMNGNYASGGGGIGIGSANATNDGEGLQDLSCFDNVTYIGGNVDVQSHKFPFIEAFNNVTTVAGGTITFSENGPMSTHIDIFNSLTTGHKYGRLDININEKSEWFTGFALLTEATTINLILNPTYDSQTWENGTIAKLDGFPILTKIKSKLIMDLYNVTEFVAFPSLTDFSGMYPGKGYMDIWMPNDPTVTLCSMMPVFTKIMDGDIVSDDWNYPIFDGVDDSQAFVPYLMDINSNCGGFGIGSN